MNMLKGIAIAAALATASAAQAQTYATKGPIEQKYMATGRWEVSRLSTTDVCDREGHTCEIWYPKDLGANGFRHPVIAWSDGSARFPENYAYLLKHWASWGFIVIGARDDATGDGATTADAANYMIAQGDTPGSPFYGKVDKDRIGTAGHSQGGASTLSLFAHQTPPFKVFVSFFASPSYFAALFANVLLPPLGNDLAKAKNGTVLVMGSVDDGSETDSRAIYEQIPDSATKAWGILAHAKHEDEMGAPDCSTVPGDACLTGVYGFLGYPTALFMWQLQGATDGVAAFHGSDGEFVQPTPDWKINGSNVAGDPRVPAMSSGDSGGGGAGPALLLGLFLAGLLRRPARRLALRGFT